MRIRTVFRFALLLLIVAALISACSDDENSGPTGPSPGELMSVEFQYPVEIEVNATASHALLLHDREAPSGPALQYVDLGNREVVATLILDYFDVYDIEFVSENEACFAGRPQGNIGYAVQFLELPSLNLTSRVMTADTAGTHGYLDVYPTGNVAYYSHAGGGAKDAVYAINLNTKTLIDGDGDSQAPFGFDNQLVAGIYDTPGRVFFDADASTIVVANLGANYITLIEQTVWGNVSRLTQEIFPYPGTDHLMTDNTGVPNLIADAVAQGGGVYAFAGRSGNTPCLSRFSTSSNGVDFVETFNDRDWAYRNSDIRIHPRQDIFSVFVLQEDSSGVSVGQFRLNNLAEVAASPYRTRHIPDSTIACVGLDTINDRLLVADMESDRIEFLPIIP